MASLSLSLYYCGYSYDEPLINIPAMRLDGLSGVSWAAAARSFQLASVTPQNRSPLIKLISANQNENAKACCVLAPMAKVELI